jgi:hypothetical protein
MPRLRDRLEAERRAMSDGVRSAYEAMIDRLRESDFVEHVLRVGDPFPDVVLPNAEGELTAIANLLRAGRWW